MANVNLNNRGHKFILNGIEYLVSATIGGNLIEKTITENGEYDASDDNIQGDVQIFKASLIGGDAIEVNDWTEFPIQDEIVDYFDKLRIQYSDGSFGYDSQYRLSEIANYTSGMDYTDATIINTKDSNTKLYLAKTSNMLYFYQEATESTYKMKELWAKDVDKKVNGFSKVIINVEGSGN